MVATNRDIVSERVGAMNWLNVFSSGKY